MPKNRIFFISFSLIFIVVFSFSGYCKVINAEKELDYCDSLEHAINLWFINPSYSFKKVLGLLNSTEEDIIHEFGNESLAYACILHKKGVFLVNYGNKTDEVYEKAIQFYQNALIVRESKINVYPDSVLTPLIVKGYSNIGQNYLRLNNPYTALDLFLKGIHIAETSKVKHLFINRILKLYILLARTYYEIGDYDNAINYYSAIACYNIPGNTTNKDKLNSWKAMAYIEMGGILDWPLNSPEDAIENLSAGLEILESQSGRSSDLLKASAFHKLGNANQSLRNFNESYTSFFKAITINKNYDQKLSLFHNYINLGVLFLDYNLDSSEYYLKKGASFIKGELKPDQGFLVNLNLGDVEFKRGNFRQSIDLYNQSIQSLIPVYSPNSFLDNPVLENTALLDKPDLLNSVSSKAKALYYFYKSTKNLKYLESAYNTFILADYLISIARSEFWADAAKIDLVKLCRPIYENAIECCWKYYQITNADTILQQAFQYSEKSRSIILLDALRKSEARSKLDPNLNDYLKQVSLKVNFFEKQAALQDQKSIHPAISINYYDSLLTYRRMQDKIVDSVKKLYPEYHAAIYTKKLTSIQDVNKLLNPEQTLIEYFAGDSNYYALIINKKKCLFLKLGDSDSIESQIRDFNNMILQKDQKFVIPGYQLYQFLLGSIDDQIDLTNQLLIVPDNLLSTLSFDLLITQNPGSERIYLPDYNDYLISKYQTSYILSANSFHEIRKKESQIHSKSLLAIAPSFYEGKQINGCYFDRLTENKKEARQIKNLFWRSKLKKTNNLKEYFLKNVSDFRIVHLSTHAKANIEKGDLSFILFNPDEKQVIYAKDLYTLNLNSEMIVLSACQTGLGSMERGEGTISLARAFIYAGSASVITSLWNVREKSNRKIILEFYKGIKSGKSRDEALRDAKLHYLESIQLENQENAHPYYWGALVCVGDTSPINTGYTFRWFILGLILLSVSGTLFWYVKSTRDNNKTT